MEETVLCPGCQAQLMLPALPRGQTVQCPRCQRVFEPFRQHGKPSVAAAPKSVVAPAAEALDEPMPTLERRWIHIAIRDKPGVATQFIGEEPNRRVVVLPRNV